MKAERCGAEMRTGVCGLPAGHNGQHRNGEARRRTLQRYHAKTRGCTPRLSLDERFRSKIRRDPETGCLEWLGTKSWDGYGRLWVGGRHVGAHQFAYVTEIGDIPEGMQLDHLCFNPPCVNVDHLEVVTPEENLRREWVRRKD